MAPRPVVTSSAGPVHFGTGAATTIDTVEVRWPSGARQVLRDVATDQVIMVVEAPKTRED